MCIKPSFSGEFRNTVFYFNLFYSFNISNFYHCQAWLVISAFFLSYVELTPASLRMEVRYLGYLGVSTFGSQPLDLVAPPWLEIGTTQPWAPTKREPSTHHTNKWKRNREGGKGEKPDEDTTMAGKKTCNEGSMFCWHDQSVSCTCANNPPAVKIDHGRSWL